MNAGLGVFLIGVGLATIVTVTLWVASQRPNSAEDALLFLASLNFRTHELLTSLIASAVSFLILGLAITAIPN